MVDYARIDISDNEKNQFAATDDENARLALFRDVFARECGSAPEFVARAGGRVNLIGEHVDYPDVQFSFDDPGHLFSMGGAVQNNFMAALSRRSDSRLVLVHADAAERIELELAALDEIEARAKAQREAQTDPDDRELPAWANHSLGAVILAQRSGATLAGMNVMLASNVPYGAGMSNSAANCVAVSLVLNAAYGELNLAEAIKLVTFARRSENSDFAGGRCGWLDQLLIVSSDSKSLTMIDYAGNKIEHFESRLPRNMQVVAINTNVPHVLAESEYNHRVRELELAFCTLSAALGRDVGSTTFSLASLNELIRAMDSTIEPVALPEVVTDASGSDRGSSLSEADLAAIYEAVDDDYKKPDTFRHADLDARRSFAQLLRRMRHQKLSSILVPLAGAAARSGDAKAFGKLINSEGESLRMSGDFQITGDNGAQDALLDIGFGEASKLGLEMYGRMLGGGGGGNVLFYVDRSDESKYQAWLSAVRSAYDDWASCELKDDSVKATAIEPVISDGARLLS